MEALTERRTIQKQASVPAECLLDRAEAKETPMNQPSESQSGFWHNWPGSASWQRWGDVPGVVAGVLRQSGARRC